MNKNTGKPDKITFAIMAAFILMSSTHFACRYDIGMIVDDFFHKVSAGTLLPNAQLPAPLAAAPVIVPTTSAAEEAAPTILHKSIARNPFLIPVAARPRPAFIPAPSGYSEGSGSTSGITPAQTAPMASKITPQLKGVVSGSNNSMAIIEFAGSSKAYRPGQSVGGYTIDSIGSKTVSLSGSTGSIELQIGGNR